MSQVDPWEKTAECARSIERSTDPDETRFQANPARLALSRMKAARL
jgi:hypothetical protein